MSEENKKDNNGFKKVVFSKDAPIVEISSKQSQVSTQEIKPPTKKPLNGDSK